jgi:hypothetical protein
VSRGIGYIGHFERKGQGMKEGKNETSVKRGRNKREQE